MHLFCEKHVDGGDLRYICVDLEAVTFEMLVPSKPPVYLGDVCSVYATATPLELVCAE